MRKYASYGHSQDSQSRTRHVSLSKSQEILQSAMLAGQVNGPVRLLPWSHRVSRLVMLRRPEGIVPVKSFSRNDRCTMFVKASTSFGIVPVSEFRLRKKTVMSERSPSSVGIVPVMRELTPTSNSTTLVSVPNSLGMVPTNLLSLRCTSSMHCTREEI